METTDSSSEESDVSDCNEYKERPNEPKYKTFQEKTETSYANKKIENDHIYKTLVKLSSKRTIMPGFGKTLKLVVICELILLIISAIFAIKSRGYVTPTKQLFSKYSLVTDFHRGDIRNLYDKIQSSDLTLVFFYAPWDRGCRLLLPQFNDLAKQYHEQVSFMAINCWQPGSDCRTRFKFSRFPVIGLYVHNPNTDRYHFTTYEGSLEFAHMSKFIRRVLRPLIHVSSFTDIAKIQLEKNGVVLFHEKSSADTKDTNFHKYYLSAISSLSYDLHGSVDWAVITDPKIASSLGLKQSSLQLVLWNSTIVLHSINTLESSTITKWVVDRFHEAASWIHITNRKSLALHNILKDNSLLILFTPNNPYAMSSDPFNLLRSVAMEYLNCDNSVRVKHLSSYLSQFSSKGRNEFKKALNRCHQYVQDQYKFQSSPIHSNDMCCCSMKKELNGPAIIDLETTTSSLLQFIRFRNNDNSKLGKDWLYNNGDDCNLYSSSVDCPHYYEPCPCNSSKINIQEGPYMLFKHAQNKIEEKGGPKEDDMIEKLIDRKQEEDCQLIFKAEQFVPNSSIKDMKYRFNITGGSCSTNRTLLMIALDSLHHEDFAQRLGIDLVQQPIHKTSVVIIDSLNQVQFIMNETLSQYSLAKFIYNFTHGLLDRNYVNEKIEEKDKEEEEEVLEENIYLPNVNIKKYLELTETPGQSVVALHYNNICGACSSSSHIILSVAKLMRSIQNLTFVRIDVTTNTMPWHLDFSTLPSIIYHPPYRKSETRIFDNYLPITQSNLFSFVIGNLDIEQRIQLGLHLCLGKCRSKLLKGIDSAKADLNKSISNTTNIIEKLSYSNSDDSKNQLSKDSLIELKEKHKNRINKLTERLNYLEEITKKSNKLNE